MPYGENVYFLDGERLDQLERYTQYQADQELRIRLLALNLEAAINVQILGLVQEVIQAGKYVDIVAQCSTAAISHALAVPILFDLDLLLNLRMAWVSTQNVNTYCEKLPETIGSDGRPSQRIVVPMLKAINAALTANNALKEFSNVNLQKLLQKYMVSIEALNEPS